MEKNNNSKDSSNQSNDEIDLRELFYLIKEGIHSFSDWCLRGLVFLFVFLKKNLLFLMIGSLLGLGLGLYTYYNFSPKNVYEMVVSPNNISNILLYDKIECFGENKGDNEYSIIIQPIKSYKENANILLSSLREGDLDKVETSITESLDIDKYMSSIKDYEYKDHLITVYSNDEIKAKDLQNKIISFVDNSSSNTERKKNELYILEKEKSRIQINLDNLNKTIRKDGSSVMLSNDLSGEGNLIINLFSTYNELSNELSEIEREIYNKKESVEVVSELSFVGKTQFLDDLSRLKPKKSSLLKSFMIFMSIGFILVLLLIVMLNTLKFLIRKSAEYKI